MQVIEISYRSAEVEPSVFLLLFFRISGIYVYEHYFDDEIRDVLYSRSVENMNNDLHRSFKSDVGIYFISDQRDLVQENSDIPMIFIVTEEVTQEVTKIQEDWIIYKTGNNRNLLEELIQKMYELQVIKPYERRELDVIAEWYYSRNINRLILKSKYFYPSDVEEVFQEVKTEYIRSSQKLFNAMKKQNSDFKECEHLYLQYAVINLLYETNSYCVRCKRPQKYVPTQLVSVCKALLMSAKINKKIETSVYMLLAQIYDDLAMDPSVAYEYYLPACEPYNAYAYFRKAIYWKNYQKDIFEAKKYYIKSVTCYPEYYRAWYNLGYCYVAMEEYEDAVKALHNVGVILKNRWSSHVLRTMEIDYLFKAYSCCAYIYYNYLNDIYQAIRENINAEHVWEEIDSSTYWNDVVKFTPEEVQQIRNQTKKELNINNIYMIISKLAMKIGDNELVEEYQRKIKENGGQRNAEKETSEN